MAATKKKAGPVQFDWAGPHGTAWGTVNTCLTVLTVTSVVHVFWHGPGWLAAAAGALGIVAVLARAALRPAPTRPGTVLYQVVCWAGASTWSAWMLTRNDWTWRSWGIGVGLLAAAAVAAGLMAAIASVRRGDDPVRETPVTGDGAARERLAIAEEWEARIKRCCNGLVVEIGAVDRWKSGHGYTLEGTLPAGGVGLDDLRTAAVRLANDADLGEGCHVEPKRVPGGSRRQFQIDVSTTNPLAGELDYPDELTPLSINDPIPVGVTPAGDVATLELRSRNLLMAGETGSGKTNAMHVTTAGLVRCLDALVFQIDLTGAGLARPWLRPWLAGKAARPAIGAVADTPEKATAMCRAIVRMGHARKAMYQDLMAEVDDDKLPIGHLLDEEHLLPEVVLEVDEIANVTGTTSRWPGLRDLISQIMNELRASGFRVVLAGLRATDDVVVSKIQAMCHIRVGLRTADKSELAWLMEWSAGLDPEDLVAEGWSYMRNKSGDKPYINRWYRLKPSQIGAIAMAAGDERDGWLPDLDPISRQAANGRNPDGTPMQGVPPSDLDWWERRWDGWEPGTAPAAPAPAEPEIPPVPEYESGATTLTEVLEGAEATSRALEDRMAEAQGLDPEEMRRHRAEFEGILAASGLDEQNWNDPATWSKPPEVEAPADVRERIKARVLDLIGDAGEEGARPKDLMATLEREGLAISRDTLHEYLKAWLKQGTVRNVRHGRWALVDGGDAR